MDLNFIDGGQLESVRLCWNKNPFIIVCAPAEMAMDVPISICPVKIRNCNTIIMVHKKKTSEHNSKQTSTHIVIKLLAISETLMIIDIKPKCVYVCCGPSTMLQVLLLCFLWKINETRHLKCVDEMNIIIRCCARTFYSVST